MLTPVTFAAFISRVTVPSISAAVNMLPSRRLMAGALGKGFDSCARQPANPNTITTQMIQFFTLHSNG
jgi:hypothetical protein